MGETVIMSKKELDRIPIIHKTIEKRLTQIEAAKLLDLSDRQVRRIVKRVSIEGDTGLIHKNRGRVSSRKFSNIFTDKIIKLYKDNYSDFKPTFASEKLFERHNIKISPESLRQILIKNNLWTTKKKKKQDLHIWRERKHYEGEMVQVDGSHHRWLESRLDQEFCLMGLIDDATGKFWGKFYEYEGTFPVLDLFADYIKIKGIPISAYIDRHSTYKINRQSTIDEELRDIQPDTQYERVMKNIGVKVIHARSPQAKGRIERVFETLQDRLVKDMRLDNICSIQEANNFLISWIPKFNNKFAKQPQNNKLLFKYVTKDFDYKWQFSIQDYRVIGNDYTIRWRNRIFLVSNPYLALKKHKVSIKQALNGDLRFETKSKILTVKEITEKVFSQVKQDNKNIIKILKTPTHRKSKKTWMDGFYVGKPSIALVK